MMRRLLIVGLGLATTLLACGGLYAIEELPPDPPPTGDAMADAAPEAGAAREWQDGGELEDGGDGGSDAGLVTPWPSTSPAPAQATVSSACLRVPAGLSTVSGVHVVSVYQGSGQSAGPRPVTVTVTGATPVTLYLASYEPVTWNVALDQVASVTKVVLSAFGANIDTTSVTGVPGATVVKRSSANTALGWDRVSNEGGSDFQGFITPIRTELQGLESTFQAAYIGSTFTVGGTPPSSTTGRAYSTTTTCADACGVSATSLAWLDTSGGQAAVSQNGLTATPTKMAWLRTTRGLRCGKHYFEVDVTKTVPDARDQLVGMGGRNASAGDVFGLTWTESLRVGIAVDLDASSMMIASKKATGPVDVTQRALGLWFREELLPAVNTYGANVVLVTRPPFLFTPPAGYAADL